MSTAIKLRPTAAVEPNHRQELALARIEFAVDELATVLLSSCRSRPLVAAAMRNVRKAIAPAVADVLAVE